MPSFEFLAVEEREQDVLLVMFIGVNNLDASAIARFKQELWDLSRLGKHVVLILKNPMCALVLGILLDKLINLQKSIVQGGHELVLCEVPDNFSQLLRRNSLDKSFEICPDTAKAIEAATSPSSKPLFT